MRLLSLRNLLLLAVLPIGTVAAGSPITINASADNRIINLFGDSVFQPDFLSTFSSGGNTQRSILQFDVSVIPVGDQVTDATLRLYGTPFGSSTPLQLDVYRLTESSIESETSWNRRSTANAWSTPGGSYVGTNGVTNLDPYASFVGDTGTGWFEWDVTALVGQWHDGVHANYGLIITGNEGNSMTFTSREGLAHANIGTSFVPELVVTSAPVPEPGTLLGISAGIAMLARRRRRG